MTGHSADQIRTCIPTQVALSLDRGPVEICPKVHGQDHLTLLTMLTFWKTDPGFILGGGVGVATTFERHIDLLTNLHTFYFASGAAFGL